MAAAGWRALLSSPAVAPSPVVAPPLAPPGPPPTVVLLGTNHGAAWLDGVGAWDRGPWRTPLGDVDVDAALTDAVVALGAPFGADGRCHLGEHSLEVQLPFVARLRPGRGSSPCPSAPGPARGRSRRASAWDGCWRRAARPDEQVLLAISSDMAHYPRAEVCERVTAALLPHVVGLDPEALAAAEAGLVRREPGVSCGMCGIAPTVLGLAALRAMGARPGLPLAAATSADAGGDPRRTVGYLAVAFSA